MSYPILSNPWRSLTGKKQPEALDVLTGFVCINPKMKAFDRAYPIRDPWTTNPSLDEGKPLLDFKWSRESVSQVWGFIFIARANKLLQTLDVSLHIYQNGNSPWILLDYGLFFFSLSSFLSKLKRTFISHLVTSKKSTIPSDSCVTWDLYLNKQPPTSIHIQVIAVEFPFFWYLYCICSTSVHPHLHLIKKSNKE